MPLTKEKEEAIRQEFYVWFSSNKTFYQVECANWIVSKLSSLLEEERKRLSEGVEKYVDSHVEDKHFNRNWLKAHFKNFLSLINNPESR